MTIQIEPVAIDGQFWISLSMDGCEMTPHGPFSTKDEAEALAARFAGICRGVFHQPVSIGEHLLTPAVPPRMAAARKR